MGPRSGQGPTPREGASNCRRLASQVQPVCSSLGPTFMPLLSARRNDRHEQSAFPYLAADPCIPRIASPQLVLVEPYLHTIAAQRLGHALRGHAVLAGIA